MESYHSLYNSDSLGSHVFRGALSLLESELGAVIVTPRPHRAAVAPPRPTPAESCVRGALQRVEDSATEAIRKYAESRDIALSSGGLDVIAEGPRRLEEERK